MLSKKELFKLHEVLTFEALQVMRKKNQDYTGSNPDPFANFRGIAVAMGVEPEIGLMLRHGDKMQRVKSFIEIGFLAVEDESVRDIAHDWINYGVLLYGMLIERQQAIMEAKGRPVTAIAKAHAEHDENTMSKKARKKVLKKRDKKIKRKYTRRTEI